MPGILNHSPAEVTQNVLVALGLGAYPANGGNQPAWPVYYDNMSANSNNVINCSDATGQSYRGNSHGGQNVHHGVQIMVRGGTPRVAYRKANAIANAARQKGRRYVTVTETGFTTTYCFRFVRVAGDVMRVGPEGNTTRKLYSVNVLVYVVQQ